MILFPQQGRKYWIVTDIWETFCPVTVSITKKTKLDRGIYRIAIKRLFNTVTGQRYKNSICGFPIPWIVYTGHNDSGAGYVLTGRELYKTKKQAQKVATRLNRKAG